MSAGPAGIVIRVEAPGDARRDPGVDRRRLRPVDAWRARIVDALREDAAAWIPDLSLVAVDEADGGRIVGHCVTTIGSLRGRRRRGRGQPDPGARADQRRPGRGRGEGIGGALIHETIERATAAGWPVIVLLGHATYYPRFGFGPARAIGIEPPEPWSDEHWMALRLPAWTPGLTGTMQYPAAFDID